MEESGTLPPEEPETPTAHQSPSILGEIVRWVVALPGGIVAAILVTFPVHWAVLIITSLGSSEDDSLSIADLPADTLERYATAFFIPLTLIYATSRIAPRYRVYVAGILSLVWAMLIGVALVLAANRGAYSDWTWLEFAAAVVVGFAGIIFGFIAVALFEQEEGRFEFRLN
jgi:hypothetical protein